MFGPQLTTTGYAQDRETELLLSGSPNTGLLVSENCLNSMSLIEQEILAHKIS